MNPLSLLTGVWGYVAAAIVAASLAGSATYYVEHAVEENKVSALKLEASQTKAASATASLTQLQGFISKMQVADTDYGATLGAINNSFVVIKKEFNNAKVVALPADCKPDAGRLRVLTDAVGAANAHSAAIK